MKGRTISPGKAEGVAIVSPEPIGFYGGIDIKTGIVIEKGHPLEGKSVKDKILVFPFGKGSTVEDYQVVDLGRMSVQEQVRYAGLGIKFWTLQAGRRILQALGVFHPN